MVVIGGLVVIVLDIGPKVLETRPRAMDFQGR
jgi:hypothetical protein